MYTTTTKEQRDRHLETVLHRTIFIGDRLGEIGDDIHTARNAARRHRIRPDREVAAVQKRRLDRLYALDSKIRGVLSHEERCELSDINVERLISERGGRH